MPKPLRTSHSHRLAQCSFLVVMALSGSCRDSSIPEVTAPDQTHKVYVDCIDPTMPDCTTSPYTDTHVSADITLSSTYTVTFDHSYTDPISGQPTTTLAVSPDPVHVHVEAGYFPDGRANISTSYTDGADTTTLVNPQVTQQNVVGDSLTDVNAFGNELALSTPDSMSGAPIMDLVGSTANGDITAGWLVDIADTLTGTSSATKLAPTGGVLNLRSPGATGIARTTIGKAFAEAAAGKISRSTFNGVPVLVRKKNSAVLEVEDADLGRPSFTRIAAASPSVKTSAGDSPQSQGRHTRTFQRHGNKWILVEDRDESDIADAHSHKHHSVVQTFKNVRWVVNASRDSARHAARPTRDWMPRAKGKTGPSNETTPQRLASSGKSSHMVMCDDACAGGGGVPGVNPIAGPAPLGSELPCAGDVVGQSSPNGTLNILYQHGFVSSAMTWCQMDRYVRQRFYVHNEIRHTLDWKASYEDQAADLGGRFLSDVATNPGPYVFVGHSNGGIVSRYTAQNLASPAMISTVITISSPHAGVYLANMDQAILTTALALPIGYLAAGCDVADTYICRHGNSVGAELAAILSPVLAFNAIPVTQEMGTNAPFHNFINARGDVPYRTAGIRNRVWDRWTPWRLMSDHNQCTPSVYIPCDAYSRTYVNAIDKTYHHYLDCSIVAGLFGFVWPGLRSEAQYCAKMAASFKAIDYAYKRLSVGSDHGDGVVPEHSQYFPGAPANRQFLVDDSDSHIGETASQHTSYAVHAAINQVAGIPFDQ